VSTVVAEQAEPADEAGVAGRNVLGEGRAGGRDQQQER